MQVSDLGNHSIGLIFPGQGSQVVGMGQALSATSSSAREALEEANSVLGVDLTDLMFNGPVETLNDTYNAQPAILAMSIAALRALEEQSGPLSPVVAAGHSLGEFTALVAAGSLPYAEALTLVRDRGRLMAEAGTTRPGGMAAVLGVDEPTLVAVCEEASAHGVINVANDNCPGQIVISGEVAALEVAMELAKAAGAKRVARLPVSIASHSPLMAESSIAFKALSDAIDFSAPAFPIIGNVSGESVTTVEGIRAELEHHVERPVKWTTSVQAMTAIGVDLFVELGPGNVLAALVKRIDRSVPTIGLAELGIGS